MNVSNFFASMPDTVNKYYKDKIVYLESDLSKIKRIISYFYFIRLLTFLSFLAFLVLFTLNKETNLYLILSFICLVLFMITVKMDFNFNFKRKFISNKLQINNNELKYLDHQYSEHETGEEFNNLNPHLATDFDIFGKGSIFQYLNRSSTKIGKNKFAENLCKSELDENLIKRKQEAIKELSLKIEFIQNIQTTGMFISEKGDETENLIKWLNQPEERLRLKQILAIVIPLMSIIWIVLVTLSIFSYNSLILLIIIIQNIILFNNRKIQKAHSQLGNTTKTFEKYTGLIKLIEEEKFESVYLQIRTLKQVNH